MRTITSLSAPMVGKYLGRYSLSHGTFSSWFFIPCMLGLLQAVLALHLVLAQGLHVPKYHLKVSCVNRDFETRNFLKPSSLS
ncbi:uncharacterized protein F4822DRAFT_280268 [Hypoxylon trugodes]|uniref:uncharacterized protein n=1 Tax=Hypoxylon trugodes TaxID=326681 RepID=UPI002196947A|nr:uncharacterized protein F4822DRAFT_280268 [Hypoxylon trugodes]KAI1387369.1 hypothetical protein F4822DRAFT_280268 [Hypoxylon trugodes]